MKIAVSAIYGKARKLKEGGPSKLRWLHVVQAEHIFQKHTLCNLKHGIAKQ